MPSLWFVMPVFGRTRLASICVRQLRRTCDGLADRGVQSTAVLIGGRRDLSEISRLAGGLQGFGWILRNNRSVSRKFNDGFELACSPDVNGQAADYVVPIGSDDWVHHDALMPLPDVCTVRGFQAISIVDEDGGAMVGRTIGVQGGWGVRVYPRDLLRPLAYRPAEEDRRMGCDMSTFVNVRKATPAMRVMHAAIDPRLVVDWKTDGEQIHPSDSLYRMRPAGDVADPFEALAGVFPDESLAEMAAHYGRAL